jgi:hypothetical protein
MRFALCLVLFAFALSCGYGQNPPPDARVGVEGYDATRLSTPPPSFNSLVKKQTDLWQARKDGDARSARKIVSGALTVTSFTGANNGKQLVNQIETGTCRVSSFKLKNFALKKPNQTSLVLTYNAIQNAACAGKTLPHEVRVEVAYFNVAGKWSMSYYLEELPNPVKNSKP